MRRAVCLTTLALLPVVGLLAIGTGIVLLLRRRRQVAIA